LEPIPTDGLTEADIPMLRDKVRNLMISELATMRAATHSL
jgi:hypothetical protein